MADETLVKEVLTAEMISSGAKLTRKLDAAGWEPTASFWLYETENARWRLVLASPKVEQEGPKKAYETIARTLSQMDLQSLELTFITVVSSDHPLVNLLASAVNTGPTITGVRFSQNTINGKFIDDAYLYRVMPSAA